MYTTPGRTNVRFERKERRRLAVNVMLENAVGGEQEGRDSGRRPTRGFPLFCTGFLSQLSGDAGHRMSSTSIMVTISPLFPIPELAFASSSSGERSPSGTAVADHAPRDGGDGGVSEVLSPSRLSGRRRGAFCQLKSWFDRHPSRGPRRPEPMNAKLG